MKTIGKRLLSMAVVLFMVLSMIPAQPIHVHAFEDTDVAAIGDVGYATVEDAFRAAQSGETIKLLKDATLTENYTISLKTTLDLNGKTLGFSNTACWYVKSYLTVKNGTFNITNWLSNKHAITISTADRTVTFKDATVNVYDTPGMNAFQSANGTVNTTFRFDNTKLNVERFNGSRLFGAQEARYIGTAEFVNNSVVSIDNTGVSGTKDIGYYFQFYVDNSTFNVTYFNRGLVHSGIILRNGATAELIVGTMPIYTTAASTALWSYVDSTSSLKVQNNPTVYEASDFYAADGATLSGGNLKTLANNSTLAAEGYDADGNFVGVYETLDAAKAAVDEGTIATAVIVKGNHNPADIPEGWTVKAGTFTSDPSAFLPEGYIAVYEGGAYSVQTYGDDVVAIAYDANGNVVDLLREHATYGKVINAYDVKGSGYNLKLMQDATLITTSDTYITQDMSIDLNGHKLTFADSGYLYVDKTLVIKDSKTTIADDGTINYAGELIIQGPKTGAAESTAAKDGKNIFTLGKAGGTLTFENVKVTRNTLGNGVAFIHITNNVTVNMTNSYVRSTSGRGVFVNAGNKNYTIYVNVDNTKIQLDNNGGQHIFYACVVDIKDSEIVADNVNRVFGFVSGTVSDTDITTTNTTHLYHFITDATRENYLEAQGLPYTLVVDKDCVIRCDGPISQTEDKYFDVHVCADVTAGNAVTHTWGEHTVVAVPGTDATCGQPGLSAGEKCSVCDAVITEQTETPATGAHAWGDWIVDTEATCGADGAQHRECANCDAVENETIAATGAHTAGEDDGDCTSPVLCTVCSQVAIPGAAEHIPEEDDGDVSTAVKCQNCDVILVEAIDAVAEIWKDGVLIDHLEADDTLGDVIDAYDFNNKGYTVKLLKDAELITKQNVNITQPTVIDLNGHTLTMGETAYLYVQADLTFTDGTAKGELIITGPDAAENTINASCSKEKNIFTINGKTPVLTFENIKVTLRDDYSGSGQFISSQVDTTINFNNVDLDVVKLRSSFFYGIKEKAAYINVSDSTIDVVDAKNGHIFYTGIVDIEDSAIVANNGNRVFSFATGTVSNTDITVTNFNNLVLNYDENDKQMPWLAEQGLPTELTFDEGCSLKGAGIATVEEYKVNVHVCATVEDVATWGVVYYGEHTDADANRVCDVCDKTLACQHAGLTATAKQDATCTADGYQAYWYCSDCKVYFADEACETIIEDINAWLADEGKIDQTGHNYKGSITKVPTCGAEGVMTYVCENDASHTYTEAIKATGEHTEAIKTENGKDATCTEDGSYDEVTYCNACGKELSRKTISVDALGHTEDEGTVTKEPTYNETGVKTYKCSVCKEVLRTEDIPVKEGAVARVNGTNYGTLAEAIAAANAGDVVYLTASVELDALTSITKNITLNLGEYNITRTTVKADGSAAAIAVMDGATVIITGNGTVTAAGGPAVWAYGGNVTIESGNYVGANHAAYVSLSGSIVIEGGKFSNTENDQYDYVLNILDKDREYCSITVKGGEFVDFNPFKNAAEGTGTNFAAEGVHFADIDGDGTFTAHAEDYKAVVTPPALNEQGYTTHTCSVCGDSYKDSYTDALKGEASIGNVGYETLEKAIEAAQPGDVIVLNENVDASAIITIDKAITIDGNRKTLTSTAARAINIDSQNAEITVVIKDLEIVAGKGCQRAINIITGDSSGAYAANVTLNNVTATENNYYAYAPVYIAPSAGAGTTLTVNESTISGWIALSVYGDDRTVEVNNSDLTGTAYSDVDEGPVVNIWATNTDISINGGSVTAIVPDGLTKTGIAVSNGYEGTNLNISKETVVTGDVDTIVAMIGLGGFATLEEAIAEAKPGDVIKLIADVELTARVKVSGTVTIDLNGNDIIANVNDVYGAIYVAMAGNLTITGEGSITNTAGYAIGNYGSLTVENGTISGADASIYNFYYNASTYGKAAINGGAVEGEIWNCGELAVNGGEIAKVDNSGALSVNGGEIAEVYGRDGSDASGVAGAGTIAIADPSAVTVPADYKLVEVSEGVYKVTAKDYVAQIGDNKYESLADALAELQTNGGTLELLADATINASIVVTKDTTINGNGHKVTVTNAYGIDVKAGVNLVINGLTLESNSYGINLRGASDNANITINDSYIKGYGALNVWGTNAIVNVNNSTLHGHNHVTGEANSFSVIILNANYSLGEVTNGTKVNVNGGKIIATRDDGCEMMMVGRIDSETGEINISEETTIENNGGAEQLIQYSVASHGAAISSSLQNAIDNAAPGETVVLLRDVTITEPIKITKNITINGNGKTITYLGNDRAIEIPNNADAQVNVTIENLTVDCTASYCQRGINYNDDGTLTLDNVTVKGTNVTYAVNLPGKSVNAVVEIKNSDLTGNIALNIWGANATVNVTDTDLTSADQNSVENYAAVSLNNDGTTAAEGAVVTITGGKITALDENGEPSKAIRNATATGTIDVSETTVVVGVISEVVAIVGYNGYSDHYSFNTLQDAINKATNDPNAYVKLLKDIELTEAITVTGTVILNLNGKTISGSSSESTSYALITNKGDLTITGDGKITYQYTGASSNWAFTWGNYTIANYGKLTVENGTIENTTDMTGHMYDAIDNHPGATAVINGGTISCPNYIAIRLFASSTTKENVVTVNGGKIVGKFALWPQNASDNSAIPNKATLTLNGGTVETVNGGVALYISDFSDAFQITKADAVVMAAPEGYEWIDGKLTEVNYVAQVGDVKYDSVLAALQAAIDNGAAQVVLLADSREQMPDDIELNLKADLEIVSGTGNPVAAKFYNVGTSYDFTIDSVQYTKTFTIGENVTFQLEDRVIWAGYNDSPVEVVVNGTLAGGQYWSRVETYVNATGTLKSTNEAMVMRYDAQLFVDGGKVEANYISINGGNIFAENGAEIVCSKININNSGTDAQVSNVNITVRDSTLTCTGNLVSSSDGTYEVCIDFYNSNVTFANHDGYAPSTFDENTWVQVNGETGNVVFEDVVNNGLIDVCDGAVLTVEDITNNNAIDVDGSAVIVNGTASINGTVNLLSADATVAYADNGALLDKFIARVNDAVIYENGVYKTHDHEYSTDVTAPTCEAKGYTTYTCELCGDSYVADYVDAKGHTEGEVVVENKINATTTATGSYENVVNCSVCGHELSRDKVVIPMLPTAEVSNLGAITHTGEYTVYNLSTGNMTSKNDGFNMPLAMQFVAKDTNETIGENYYKEYITDFYLKFEGLSGDSYVADDCYLAGYYGNYGWVLIPLDGFAIENGVTYPVLNTVGIPFTYEMICTMVKDFKCGVLFSDEFLANNPNVNVTLSLGLSETVEEAENAEFTPVDAYTYDEEELNVKVIAENTTIGVKYYGLQAALDAATAGQTVKVVAPAEEAYIMVPAGVTLDLNGNTVTVGSAASFGVIMGEGKLAVAKNAVAMSSNGNYLPVYEGDGYVFKSIYLWTYEEGLSGEEYVVKFAEYDNRQYFKNLIAQGDSKFDVIVRASWITGAGDNAVQDFIFSDAYLTDYANRGEGFSFTITGTEGKTDFDVEILFAYQVGNYVVEVFEYAPENNAVAGNKVESVENAENVAEVNGVGYTSVAEALANANGGTVKMIASSTEAAIMVPAGVSLDLNGKTLTVGSAASFGAIIDEIGGGKLVVGEYDLAMSSNGYYLPVYEGNGYVFKYIYLWTYEEGLSGEEYVVKFAEYENRQYFKDLIAQGDSKFDVIVRASWITGAGDNAVQDFIFSDAYLTDYANRGEGFSFTITGTEGKTDFDVEILFAYQAGNYVVEVFE